MFSIPVTYIDDIKSMTQTCVCAGIFYHVFSIYVLAFLAVLGKELELRACQA